CSNLAAEPAVSAEVLDPAPIVRQTGSLRERERGRTDAEFSIYYDAKVEALGGDDGYCLRLSHVDFAIGYRSIRIFILDKYKPSSCEYKAILDHESQHAEIFSRVLRRYGRLLEDELRIAALNMRPLFAFEHERERANKTLGDFVRNNDRIAMLTDRIKKELDDENAKLDTDEEYRKIQSRCKNW
ncbi:MAG: hypothetical protein LBH41_00935, partial [Rickettsiales bacterium]|nr:hypothetical protein [Rickettsiales bacterium]